ncbi:MAG: hypothetical protein ACTFAL_00375 [Candidatus Electronema sp. V4]|uniref:hypothetical protein n=1 Tax=Candidatus Electronema sp. V4 TaxID=3454756 RepID=UPI0040554C0F
MNPLIALLKSHYTKKRLFSIFSAWFLVFFCLSSLYGGDADLVFWLLFVFFEPLVENEIHKRL